MIEAYLYKRGSNADVDCLLCAHFCHIRVGKTGICGVRKNIDGVLYSLNSDRLAAAHVDPIEKKPLYHYLPGSHSFSIAAMGCNFFCKYCQNYSLSIVKEEKEIQGEKITPERLIEECLSYQVQSISYTYSEPTIFFELMIETAKLARESGIGNVMVTNGYMSEKALDMISPYIDAANIDLKSFSEDFYKKYCRAHLQPVLDTISLMQQKGIWVEITTLLIPRLNDQESEIHRIVDFIANLNPSIPWHVSRFFPQFLLRDIPVTPEERISGALKIARKNGLQHIYGGNIQDEELSSTFCPRCGEILIRRQGYRTTIISLDAGICKHCGTSISGIWNQ